MKRVLLDTNFFLVPFQLGVNIMSELDRVMEGPYQLMTISPVVEELERLANSGKGDDRNAARLAMHLARNIDSEPAEGKGDEAILAYAKNRDDVVVATNDSALRRRLRKAKLKTIFVRNRSILEME